MRVTIYGSGYVGLVQAAVFAQAGHQVCCVDIDTQRVAKLKRGEVPIYEPGLQDIIQRTMAEQRLVFTADTEQGVAFSDIQFIAVGTPSSPDGSADLSAVMAVATSIGTRMQSDKIVVNKSTVPVGTADEVAALIKKQLSVRAAALNIDVASNPEFLKEGAAIKDCRSPDRIIIGAEQAYTIETLKELYAPFCRQRDKVIVMDRRSAELTKYASNCMLATKISFINEMANMAEKMGANIEDVRQGMGADPRIGYHFIYPGLGYGGSCFPKDIDAMLSMAQSEGVSNQLLSAVRAVNEQQKQSLANKVKAYFGENLKGKTFALWGLAFKPNTDDIRQAPSIVTIDALIAAGAKVKCFDPKANNAMIEQYQGDSRVQVCASKEQVLIDADALLICTEWEAFRAPDFEYLKSQLRTWAIFDGRNLFTHAQMKRHGFDYFSIGRQEVIQKAAHLMAV